MVKFLGLPFMLLLGCSFEIRASSSDREKEEKNTVRIQISNSGLKPWANLGDGSAIITFDAAVHGHALNFTPDLHIKPGYIKSWLWDDKKKAYTLKMDSSRRYHNGKPISAYDFELVLIKPFITEAETGDKAPLTPIKGIRNLRVGMPFKSGMLEGIKVIDNETVDVYLESSHTRFLYALGRMLPALAPIEEFKDDYFTFKSLPVGSGPYKVVWSDPNSSMVKLERVYGESGPKYIELYSHGKGWENKVDIALGAGRSQMKKYMDENPGKYSRLQGLLPNSIEVLEFNFQIKSVQDLNFRRAVALSVNNEIEIPGFPAQNPTDQIIPIVSYGYQKPKSHFNLQQAKKLFNSLPKEVRDATYKISFHGAPEEKIGKYYIFIKESLEAMGMKVAAFQSQNTGFSKGDKETAMIVYGRFVDSDPVTAFAHYLPGEEHFHVPRSYPEYSVTFEKAALTNSVEERVDLIHRMSNLLREQQVVVPLHQRHPVYFHSSRIKSIGVDESAWNVDLSKIELIK